MREERWASEPHVFLGTDCGCTEREGARKEGGKDKRFLASASAIGASDHDDHIANSSASSSTHPLPLSFAQCGPSRLLGSSKACQQTPPPLRPPPPTSPRLSLRRNQTTQLPPPPPRPTSTLLSSLNPPPLPHPMTLPTHPQPLGSSPRRSSTPLGCTLSPGWGGTRWSTWTL